MVKNKKVEISLEEKLEKALVPVEEQPYKIPNNWVWVGLKYISKKIFAGGDKPENFSKIKTDKNVFPIFSNGIDKNGLYGYTDEPRVLEKALTVSARGTIGFTKIREANFTPIIRLIVIILKDRILYEFLDYYFKYNSLVGVGSSIPQLTVPIVNEKIIPLPPLNEQKRIVEKLDFLFDKIKKAKELIEEIKIDIENRKISILDRAFKGALTSKWRNKNKVSDVKELLKSINDEKIKKWEEDCLQAEKDGNKKPKKPIIKEVRDMIVPVDEQPYKLPDNWVWVRLGDLGDYKKGPFGSSLTKSMFVEKGVDTIKVYEQKNAIQKDIKIGNYYITKNYFLEAMTGFEVNPNDIIVSCAGTVGETYIIPNNAEKGIINQALMKITLIEQIHKKYYLEYFDYFLKEEARRQSQGTAIKNIPPFKIFKEFSFPLPPLEEQQEIVRILDEVLESENKVKELLELEERIDLLEKSILHKAFKGELGTQNSNDESAIEL